MSKPTKLTVEITEEQAWAFAPFLKRIGFSDYRALAINDNKAYLMRVCCTGTAFCCNC